MYHKDGRFANDDFIPMRSCGFVDLVHVHENNTVATIGCFLTDAALAHDSHCLQSSAGAETHDVFELGRHCQPLDCVLPYLCCADEMNA